MVLELHKDMILQGESELVWSLAQENTILMINLLRLTVLGGSLELRYRDLSQGAAALAQENIILRRRRN